MSYRKYSPFFTLALLASLTAPVPWRSTRAIDAVFAQSSPAATFPLPTSVPADTKISIDGSKSLQNINRTIDEGFEKAFPGTTVTADYNGSDAALKAVEEGKTDLAAIGRSLTAAEKARGLVEIPIARQKIALITSPDNAFAGSLTIEQFAAIFHGKIKNWSEVGGPADAIVFVDRPATSDTRSAFQNYPVFQKEPFTTGPGTVTVTDDTVTAVAEKLGKNGIGYAIIDQVENNPSVKIIKMHDTLPSDPKYPFSQSLVYVYKGPNPNAAVQAFLGFATSPDKQAAIEAARRADAGIVASPSPSPEAVSQAPVTTAPAERSDGLPGWLWWLLPLAALIALPFLLKGRGGEPVAEPAVAPPEPVPAVPPVVTRKGRIILVPRNCKEAYAYWEVSTEEKADLRRQGGEKLAIRVYDVTDIDLDKQPAHDMREYDCREAERDLQVPIPVDDRDYVAELGYVTPDGNWLKLARSEHVRVPACSPTGELLDTGRENLSIGAGTALAGATALAAGAAATVGGLLDRDRPTVPEPVETLANDLGSRIVLVPRNCRKAYAYWELSETDKARLSGDRLVLRVYDVTDIELNFQSAHNVQEFECSAPDRDLVVPIATDNRDYLAEIGIVTPDGAWSPIARSEHVRVPACPPGSGLVDNARESLANVTETLPERVTDARQNISNTFTNVTENLSERLTDARETLSDTFTNVTKSEEAPAFQAGVSLTESLPESVTDALENLAGVAAFGAGAVAAARSRFGDDRQDSETERSEGQIVYVPRDSQEAYIYWEISDTTKAAVRSRENDRLALRIYDLTDSNDDGTPDSVWEYEIEESDRDKTIPIHRHDRHYAAELGYRTEEGRWLAIARSESVYVPTPPEPEA